MLRHRLSSMEHGNYKDYYSKRASGIRDPRLTLLPQGLIAGARVLDVGCNQGRVTSEAAQIHDARRVVGVDIDATLVSHAWKHRRNVWSMQGPPTVTSSDSALGDPGGRKRRRSSSADAGDNASSSARADYFPAAFQHMFGPLPMPPTSVPSDTVTQELGFPLNVTFRTADWAKHAIPEDEDGWDVVLAFSVSKWIHLAGKDEGLRRFFQRAFDVLRPGGAFVLEPQEWSSYSKAWRMNPTLKDNAKDLSLRPDDFAGILLDIGFAPAQHLGSTGCGGFRRPVDMYIKPQV